jgi:hypothetical protein
MTSSDDEEKNQYKLNKTFSKDYEKKSINKYKMIKDLQLVFEKKRSFTFTIKYYFEYQNIYNSNLFFGMTNGERFKTSSNENSFGYNLKTKLRCIGNHHESFIYNKEFRRKDKFKLVAKSKGLYLYINNKKIDKIREMEYKNVKYCFILGRLYDAKKSPIIKLLNDENED